MRGWLATWESPEGLHNYNCFIPSEDGDVDVNLLHDIAKDFNCEEKVDCDFINGYEADDNSGLFDDWLKDIISEHIDGVFEDENVCYLGSFDKKDFNNYSTKVFSTRRGFQKDTLSLIPYDSNINGEDETL